MNIEQKILNTCISQGITLSLAESCTGGEISASLTKIPDASKYFIGSIICYSSWVKEHVLKVPSEIIHSYGVVSEEVATEMVKGVRDVLKSDVALAITGVTSPSKDLPPVGTVYIAIANNKVVEIHALLLKGNRVEIIHKTAQEALKLLYKMIK